MDHDYQVYAAAAAVELLPCPFCRGGDAFVEQSTFASSYAICNDCMARGPDATQQSDNEDEPGRDAAIAAWNTRAAPPPPAGSDGWRDIGSAPKDGTLFDVWVPSYAEPGKGYRIADLHMDRDGVMYRRRDPQPVKLSHPPTHWRPLPEAPTPPVAPRG